MAQLVLACLRKFHRRVDLDASAFPIAQSLARRVDLRPLDHGAHEPGALRMVESSHGRLSFQGLRRGSRAAGAMVQAGAVGVVCRARRGRVLLALRPLQRQAVSRLGWLRAHLLSSGDDWRFGFCLRPRSFAAGRSRQSQTGAANARGSLASCCCSPFLARSISRPAQISILPINPRHRRPHWRKPA